MTASTSQPLVVSAGSPDEVRLEAHPTRANHAQGSEGIAEKAAQTSSDEDGYTSFTRSQLRGLQLLLGFSAITSPLTATIYFPLLPLLQAQFHTSAQGINLTLTIYIIFQAISPVIFGPLSDSHGRRLIFLVTLGIYLIGNVGLAVNQHNYPALLVVRAFQSMGASAAYVIAMGIVADVCIPSERGRMLGPINMALNLGACVGPVVGGLVAYLNGNHTWVFLALVIVSVILLSAVGLLLPETARILVGNGENPQSFKWWQLSWLGLVQRAFRKAKVDSPDNSHTAHTVRSHQPAMLAALKSFLNCFRIIFYKDTFLTVWIHGSFYVVDYSFVTALPDIFKNIYGYNELYIGLAYLPRGVGIIIGSYCTGKLMDYNYRATIHELEWTTSKVAGEDIMKFPIERARSRSSYWFLIISTGTMIGYGWAVSQAAHPAVILALQFLQGFWGTYFYATYGVLMVDIFPESPSTAAAATSVTRCAMAATGVAILQPLLNSTGRGWYFTGLGLWSGICCVLATFILRRKGMRWRRIRNGLGDERTMSA